MSQEPEPVVFATGEAAETASEPTVSSLMVLGPITKSAALCANELPVPKAKPSST